MLENTNLEENKSRYVGPAYRTLQSYTNSPL